VLVLLLLLLLLLMFRRQSRLSSDAIRWIIEAS